ncbi:LxmA leader domain family RiPP [Streptomyces sp. NPDC006283]|uniref:LxmA leader domain family RiPP n=1 Tax=Streptomyces sp. NPDC006283 TaxID=3156741 RepID=UPI0033B46A5D
MAELGKTAAISELVAGYDTYSEAGELVAEAAADAPASTPACAAATISWLGSQLTVKTYKDGC